MLPIIVVDTNVFIAALLGPGGANRKLLRHCLERHYQPLMGTALLLEYEDVLGREALFADCQLSSTERDALLNAFLSVCRWTTVYYTWRPNLSDERDNHLAELAVAGGAAAIVTRNVRDFERAQLQFPDLQIVQPEHFIGEER